MYFPYDYIYPEQHSYMVELKRTLDAKAGHLGEGGREGRREGGKGTVTISGVVVDVSADACMMVVCITFHVSWCVMPLYAPMCCGCKVYITVQYKPQIYVPPCTITYKQTDRQL